MATSNDLNISESGLVSFDGTSTFHGRTLQQGTGITITNANGVSGDPVISSTASLTDLHTSRYIVSSSTSSTGANYNTIQSAIDAASGTGVNQTVFIQPKLDGTAYTENLTLRPGINLAAYNCDAQTPNVTISGKCTFTQAGKVTISGIRLASNGAEFLSVTGSVASIVNLNNCYLTTAFDPGITFSSSDSGAQININYCQGDITSSSTKLFVHSSSGLLIIKSSFMSNTGSSSTANTCSAGSLQIAHSNIVFPITTSNTASLAINHCQFDTSSTNTTTITCGGSGNSATASSGFVSGTASAISISSSMNVSQCTISSSNTNAITGAGTILYNGISFTGSSTTINTTTQTTSGTLQGSKNTAPTAGMLGQRLEGTATSVAVTSNVAKTITSVSLTPGIWDISALATTVATGGTALATAIIVDISTTDNTIEGASGIQYFQINTSGAVLSGSVPAFRVTLSSTTTYYLVCIVVYTSTTSPTNGRISATRVG